jgi:hypothetical protein
MLACVLATMGAGCAEGALPSISSSRDASVDRVAPSPPDTPDPEGDTGGDQQPIRDASLDRPTDGGSTPSDVDDRARDVDCDSGQCVDDASMRDVSSVADVETDGMSSDVSTSRDARPSRETDSETDVAPDADACTALDCTPHGTCRRSSSDTYTCDCDAGYVFARDTCIPDPCEGVTCNGRGTCRVDGEGRARCDCNAGYEPQGTTCRGIDRDGDGAIASQDCDDRDPERTPGREETCDGTDNDCDGDVDESLQEACPKQQGVCGSPAQAVRVCRSGTWTSCEQAYGGAYQTDETRCDGRDNDCDGQIDEAPQCTGSLSCFQMIRCSGLCSDQSCQQTQFFDGTTSAQNDYSQFQTCFGNNDCGSATNLRQCLQNNCSASFRACYGTPNGSGLSCSEYLRCNLSCPASNQTCLQDCYGRIASGERTKVDAFFSCLDSNCPTQTPSCIRNNCRQVARTCYGCREK